MEYYYSTIRNNMPALNFIKEMAPKVELGLKEPDHPDAKRQTIRALRKDGRNPRPGQSLCLYTGIRKLGEAACKDVEQISIEENNGIYNVVVRVHFLSILETKKLALADGFNSSVDFYRFFRKTHGLPFYGLLIKW